MIQYFKVLFLLSFCCCVTSTDTQKKGPFVATLKQARDCSAKEVINPDKDYGTYVRWYTEIYNSSGTTYMKGNYTVLKKIDHIKVRARSYFWEDNQWKIRVRIPGLGCQRQIFRLFFRLSNWKVDANKCAVEKGTASWNLFDYNVFYNAWESETDYGQWLWIFEFTNRAKTLVCLAVESIVTPRH